jgi:hypothetical protein
VGEGAGPTYGAALAWWRKRWIPAERAFQFAEIPGDRIRKEVNIDIRILAAFQQQWIGLNELD